MYPKSPPDTTDRKNEPTYTKIKLLTTDDLNDFGIWEHFLSDYQKYFSRDLDHPIF